MTLPSRLITIFTLIAAMSLPAVADERKAAEYFALAQSAEKRSDWQIAVDNYERAYKESPHPDILFNIAVNYQRMAKNRDAARYLQRFANDTAEAAERNRALEKIKELRALAGAVSFSSMPAGATILVDGEELGQTPVTKKLAAGAHTAVAVTNGTRSQPRRFVVEFGEPVSIDFRTGAKPGRLTVNANVREAEVMIDGVPRGRVPFSGMLPAGKHTVLVSAPGYQTVARDIEVPEEGSEQISARLQATSGAAGIEPIAKPVARPSYLLGFGFGLSSETDAEASGRALVEGGLRTATQRFDLVGMYGSYGGNVGFGFGGAARFYFGGQAFRPYARAAIMYGRVDDFEGNSTGALAGEGGIGFRYIGRPNNRRVSLSVEYFAEVNFQLASASTDEPATDNNMNPLTRPPLAAISLSFPVTLGIALRFGARQ